MALYRDNRLYQYDNNGYIVRERTEEEIKFIDLFDSTNAHREWLEHLEELIVGVAFTVRNKFDDPDVSTEILATLQKYWADMENL